jgi:hypothetical protein
MAHETLLWRARYTLCVAREIAEWPPSVPTSLETVPPRYLSSDGRRMVPQACPSHPKFQVEKAPPPGANGSSVCPT